MSWKAALTEYAENNGQYVIPKKNTPQYDEVKKIQERLKASPSQAAPVPKTKKGKGIKETFVSVINKVNNSIDKNIEPVPDDVPLEPTEYHAKKIVRRDGKIKRQNYNFLGPGTAVEKRLEKNIKPIDNLDDAARDHDVIYTLDFQKRMKQGQTVSKKEVQLADKRFVEKVKKNSKDNPVLAAAIPPIFKAKEIAENVGVLPHTAFFNPKTTGSGVSTKPKKQANKKK
jgi:hypothetical protein